MGDRDGGGVHGIPPQENYKTMGDTCSKIPVDLWKKPRNRFFSFFNVFLPNPYKETSVSSQTIHSQVNPHSFHSANFSLTLFSLTFSCAAAPPPQTPPNPQWTLLLLLGLFLWLLFIHSSGRARLPGPPCAIHTCQHVRVGGGGTCTPMFLLVSFRTFPS